MKKIETGIEGLFVLEPRVFEDPRGYFMETFNQKTFSDLGLRTDWVQDNHSRSSRGVLRGLHFQKPNPQAKLVRVSSGVVYDVAVDLRPDSKTFGKWHGVELSVQNKRMFLIPEGFAHGFCVVSETADFLYKCSALYSPKDEQGMLWNDPALGIPWPLTEPILSEKDKKYPTLKDYVKGLRV